MPDVCAGSHCVADNGARVEAVCEAREEAGLRGLLRPEAWSLQLSSPALAGASSIGHEMHILMLDRI